LKYGYIFVIYILLYLFIVIVTTVQSSILKKLCDFENIIQGPQQTDFAKKNNDNPKKISPLPMLDIDGDILFFLGLTSSYKRAAYFALP